MTVPKGPLGRQNQAFELEMKPQDVKLWAEVWCGPHGTLSSLWSLHSGPGLNCTERLRGPSPWAGLLRFGSSSKSQGKEGKKKRCVGLQVAPSMLSPRKERTFCLYSSCRLGFTVLTVVVNKCTPKQERQFLAFRTAKLMRVILIPLPSDPTPKIPNG